MHKQDLIACIKVNGKILREYGETVRLPFGTEYTIFIKNLRNVKASVKVFIDGKDIANGYEFIVHPHDSVELERTVVNCNLNQGNRFKFIERTENVEKHRGIGAEDGIVRIEYQFERETIKIPPPDIDYWHRPTYPRNPGYPNYPIRPLLDNSAAGDYTKDLSRIYCSAASANSSTAKSPIMGTAEAYSATLSGTVSMDAAVNTISVQATVPAPGITVPGSISTQQFNTTGPLVVDGNKYTMILRLEGEITGQPVIKPITVEIKPKCITCGKVNRSDAKYCDECGTSLQIV